MKKSSPTAILFAIVAAIAFWLGIPNLIPLSPAAPPQATTPTSTPTTSPTSVPVSTTGTSTPAQFQGKVIGVSDGDTIKVLVGTEQIKVRFSHIDAPEKKQVYGSKANEFLSTMLAMANNQVTVEDEGKDRYGRTLGVIYTTDGTYNFNLGMIENGYAWHYVQYSKDQNYAAAEANARAKRLGLWADTQQPIPPWEFRANK